MDTIQNKCVILKNLPANIGEDGVRKCLERNDFGDFCDLERYAVNDTDVRWIVFFKTSEEAKQCLDRKQLTYLQANETFSIIPDLCSECLIPERWFEQDISCEGETSLGADGWEDVSQECFKSEDLFGSVHRHLSLTSYEQFFENDLTSDDKIHDGDDDHKPNMGIHGNLDNTYETEQQGRMDSASFAEYSVFRTTQKEHNAEPKRVTSQTAQVSETDDKFSGIAGKITDLSEFQDDTESIDTIQVEVPKVTDDSAKGFPPVSMANSPLSPPEQGSDIYKGDSAEKTPGTDSIYLTVTNEAETVVKSSICSDSKPHSEMPTQSVPKSKDMQSSTSELWSLPYGYPMPPMFPFVAHPNVPVTGIGFLPVSTTASPQLPSACPIFVQPYYPGHPGLHPGYPGFYMPYPSYPNFPPHFPPGLLRAPVASPKFNNMNHDSLNSQSQRCEGSTHVKSSINDNTKISLSPELPPKRNKSTTDEEPSVYHEMDVQRDNEVQGDDEEEHIYDSVDSMTMLGSEMFSSNKPKVPPRETQLRVFVEDEDVEAASCPKVTVTGFQADTVNEEMELFFESKSKSGGGDIVAFELSKNKKSVTIEYKNCKDSEDVLRKANKDGGIYYKGTLLKVTNNIVPKMDPVRVFVSGMSDKTTDEIATLFMEAKWRIIPKKILRGKMPGTAVIEFDKQPDFNDLKTMCERHACAEAFWTVSLVELSSKVLVKECNSKTTSESLELYFENRNRSGGGDVLYVEPHHDLSHAFIVCFKHVSDAERVINDDRTHVLDNNTITVSLYYPCLDRDPSEETAIPEPVLIEDLDQYRARFLFESDQQKAKVEASLKDAFGRPVWIVDENGSKLLQIECTDDPKDSSSRPFINHWKERCRERISWIFNELKVDETNVMAIELFDEMKIKLQNIKVRRPEALAIVLERKSSGIVIVGEVKEVDPLSSDIAKLITEMENELEKNNKTATKTLKLRNFEYILLKASNISGRLQTEKVDVAMDGLTKQLTFSGRFQNVANAVSIVQDTLTNFVRTDVPGYTQLSVDLLFKNQTRHLIKKALFNKKLIGVWDFEKRTTLYMYSSNENDLQKCVQILRETLLESNKRLSDDETSVLNSSKGTDFLHHLETKHEGLVKFAINGPKLRIASVAEVNEEITKELESFVTDNSEACKIIEIEPGKFQFIYTHKKDELRSIEEQCQRQNVVCTCIDEPIKKGFMFQGPQVAVKSEITKIQTLIDNIVFKDIAVTYPGCNEFIGRKSGKKALKEIEDKRQCVLRYKKSNINDDLENGHIYSIGSCKLTVILRDITGIKAAAMINACSGDLSNTLGLGALLVKKGGLRIQQELDAQKEKKVMIGDVYVTQAGNLPYKAIIHVVVPTWSDKTSTEKRLLGSTIFNAIEHADKMGFKQIVTPPIGTGIPGFPSEIVAETMLDTLAQYFQSGQKHVIENIIICDIKEENIDACLSTLDSGDEVRLRERRQEAQPRSSAFESKVSVVIGTLASTKADVLVNSTNQDLDLRLGTISKQLVAAAGEELIQECKQRYPNGISLGKVAVTSAGQLKTSQRIFHGLLPPWDSGKGRSDTVLFQFVSKCLQKAAGSKFRSISFPALGTGALGYPSDQVADIMFDAVERFFKDYPKNSLESIYFVLWSGDAVALSAFEDVEKSKTTNIERRRIKPSQYIPNVGEEYAVAEEKGEFTTTIGHVSLKIVQEDLVKQTTGGIVNSTLDELDLSKGLVSKAILDAAGPGIQRECWQDANKKRIQTEGIVVTGPGKLMCQKIIHLKARNSASGWSEALLKGLREVDNLGLSSVALPALGTGGKGLSPDTMAKTMYQAVKQYVEDNKGKGSLTSVRIVLFNSDLVDKFTSTIKNLSGRTRQSRTPFFKKQDTRQTGTIYIYAYSEHTAQQAAADVLDLYDSQKVGIPKTHMKIISEKHLTDLKQRADKLGVTLVDKPDGIVIQGLKCNIQEMKDIVDRCRESINRTIQTQPDRKSIPLPPSWKMTMGDTTKVVQLNPSDQEYTILAKRFCSETLVPIQNIVSIERIQNPTLYMQYYGKKKEMETANIGSHNPIERRLWLGTRSADVTQNINQKGFDRKLKSDTTLGSGVMFAVDARTALGYCQADATGSGRMYYVDVLTGDSCAGSGYITKPPSRNDPKNPMRCFDSTTDNMSAPGLFIIFHDAQAYPSFLITFR
ncbi:protein mono-ADP-ribosyltransferase PARP14-like isoform X2 [Dreissena polymorpha]|uniref:protein mono-ADP-ribosyltransferase PARP14-like isoform X2 n=1 Tax=Dreissena polymorpha TaxID=45954 RepID=UPI002264A23A|nr:protein mono-ADP-ribosyltransferase PARP14-like isoform X2 [Dreissena polymorpha]